MSRDRKKPGSQRGELSVVGAAAGLTLVLVGTLAGFLLESVYRKNPRIDTRTSVESARVPSPGNPGGDETVTPDDPPATDPAPHLRADPGAEATP